MRSDRELKGIVRRLTVLGALIALLLALGTVAFVVTEEVGVWDGFVWALDTIATTGSIPAPRDTGGQIAKVGLTLLGVGTLFYALVTVTELFVTGHLGELLSQRRRQRMIDALSDRSRKR